MTTPLERWIESTRTVRELFDRLPDVVFFAKDPEGRYLAANDTLLGRLGATDRGRVLGRTARDLFPVPLGARYLAQDLAVCRSGEPIVDLLELHLYPDRSEGWCVTDKRPIHADDGSVLGLAGTSRDLHAPATDASLGELASVVQRIREDVAGGVRVDHLAALAGLSPFRLNRRLRAVFGLSAQQLIVKTRIDRARRMLRATGEPIGRIAAACGYCDQSAFTRQFKATTGLTPAQYRERGGEPSPA